jgi:ABC-type uncharacterized transport system, permease component
MTKIQMLLSLSYKFEFFTNLLTRFILLFVTAFFWKAAYSNLGTVGDISQNQMLTYSVISLIMSSIFSVRVENTIHSRVRMGNVAVDFIKPVNIFLMYLTEDIGHMVNSLLQTALPILICSSLFIIVPLPASFAHFLLFLVSAALSYAILWLISAIFGLFYFWFIEMGPVGEIKNYLVQILSGVFIPIWFFPQVIQDILKFLPFIYIYQHPIGIYIGRTPFPEALMGLVVQLVWIALFTMLFKLLQKRVMGNILVQGG